MKRLYIVLSVMAFFLIPPIIYIVRLHALGQIQFIPDKFAEEFWKFLVSLASIIFGFILINVLWAEKEKRDKISQGKSVLLNYLLRINQISKRIIVLLSHVFSVDEYSDANQARDDEVVFLAKKIEKLVDGLESTAFDPLLFSDSIGNNVFTEIIWEELIPNAETLTKQKNFREHFDEFNNAIKAVIKCSDNGIRKLTGSKELEA